MGCFDGWNYCGRSCEFFNSFEIDFLTYMPINPCLLKLMLTDLHGSLGALRKYQADRTKSSLRVSSVDFSELRAT